VTHFFAPAWRNPAVEVIEWKKSDPAVVEYLRWAFCMTGKVPLLTADVACFMLDRIFDNWCNESALLLDRATAAEVDSVAAEFVHAGPFFVLNLAHGNPIITETNTLQAEMEGAHYDPAPIFKSVDTWVTVPPGKKVEVAPATARAIRERLLGILFSQSVDIVDRQIGDSGDLDLGCRLALGFKHGPLDLMRSLGEQTTGQALIRLRSERAGMPMPTRPFDAYQGFLRHILVDDLGDVKVITLRRPEAMNALHDDMNNEILSVIRRFENDPKVTGFVITGYGTKAFCAGGDIGRFVDMLGDADASAQYARDCSRLLVHLDQMKKPVVAALNGIALGGGFELASALPQHRRHEAGVDPDARGDPGHHPRHRRHGRALPPLAACGADLQRHAAHGGTPQGNARAHELGIVDGLAENTTNSWRPCRGAGACEMAGQVKPIGDNPVQVTIEPVEARAASGQVLSRECIELMERSILEAAAAASFAEALEVGYRSFGLSACLDSAREGITAFKEKRTPDFTQDEVSVGGRPAGRRSLYSPSSLSPGWSSGRRPSGQWNLRSDSLIGRSLMLAKRRIMKPCSLNSQFSLP
jgi:enoyl-CoA hydratase/3-hydroxyacyl-CoA dehydrogenase